MKMTENELKLFSMIEDIQIILNQLIYANEQNVSWETYNNLSLQINKMRKQIVNENMS